jgi:hypothetical protein
MQAGRVPFQQVGMVQQKVLADRLRPAAVGMQGQQIVQEVGSRAMLDPDDENGPFTAPWHCPAPVAVCNVDRPREPPARDPPDGVEIASAGPRAKLCRMAERKR